MPQTDRKLESPRRNQMVRGAGLLVRGSFVSDEPVLAVVVFLDGTEKGRVAPERRGGRLRYCLFVDVSRTSCRLDVEVKAERLFGDATRLHRVPAWRPAFRPERRRSAVVAVEAASDGTYVSGRVACAELIKHIEIWSRGRRAEAAIGPDGRFDAAAPDAPAHLWAAFRDGARPDAHLGRLPPRAAGDPVDGPLTTSRLSIPDGPNDGFLNGKPARASIGNAQPGSAREAVVAAADAVSCEALEFETQDGRFFVGRRAAFQPMRVYGAASAAGRTLTLTYPDGHREQADVRRMVASGDGWTMILNDGEGFRPVAVADLAGVSVGEAAAPPSSGAPAPKLRDYMSRLPKPVTPLCSDEPPLDAVALPALGMRAPPASIGKVVLIRQDDFPTDALYVRAPLAQLVAERGIPFEIVSVADTAGASDAACNLALDERSVVIVSRNADSPWLDRLVSDPAPFVIYVMDDDALAISESNGLPPRYRRRMLEMADADFRPLLQRCDRYVATSPGLAARYASVKTVLIEPPFIRPAVSLAHLDDLAAPRIAYHGTCVHHDDIGFLFGEIEALLTERPNVRFQLISDQTIPDDLSRLPNFELFQPMPWRDYVAFSAANPAHIFLAPMLDTPFNAGKSIVKLHDAASLGAVGVYSDVRPFSGVVTNGEDGFLIENDPPAWGFAIRALLDDPIKLHRTALAGQSTAALIGDLATAGRAWRELLGLC